MVTGTLTNLALLLGRIIVVLPLLPNGMRKIDTFAQTAAGMGGTPQIIQGRPFPGDVDPLIDFPVPELFLGASVLFDIAGAILVIVGFRARLVAALLSLYVLMAMTIYHYDLANPANLMSLLRGLPILGGLLVVAGAGAGAWSLDGRSRRAGG